MNQKESGNVLSRLNDWKRTGRVQTALNLGLVFLGPMLAALTVLATGRFGDRISVQGLRLIFLLDFVYVAGVTALVARRIYQLLAARRARSAGSSLHLRLSGVFAGIALVPTVLVAVIATVTLNFGVESWFSERVRDAIGSSLSAAQAYEKQERDHLIEDALILANFLARQRTIEPLGQETVVREILTQGQSRIQRGFKEAFVIDGQASLRARGDRSYLFDYEAPTEAEIVRAADGEVVVIKDWNNNEFRALAKIPSYLDNYLYVSRTVDGNILNLLDETTETAQLYHELEGERGRLLFDLGLVYLGFAVLVILGAIWIGLWIGERLARPVGRLAEAAQLVSGGDLDVRVREARGDDEFAVLGRVFNHMTRQVKRQRDDLIAAHASTERRRRLFDSVLSGVTAGVIGLDARGNIEVVNAAAQALLNLDGTESVGRGLTEMVPEFSRLFNDLQVGNSSVSQGEVHLTRSRKSEILLVRIAGRYKENRLLEGFVVTFDDVTQLISAQRMAAWGDVARRIAHEIKNPLTPIRLSAEQLRRKLRPVVGDRVETLDQYSDVIIRQTNDLRRIVDEFSRFARMPEPKQAPHDLRKLVEDTVALQRNALPGITVRLENFENAVMVSVDATMISQALINLIKNAGEAVEAFMAAGNGGSYAPEVRISAKSGHDHVELCVADNGIGLPAGQRSRLFEPYVTHRDEGTGLGLSIVRKIIEQHGGTLELLDAQKFEGCEHVGALARIVLPGVIERGTHPSLTGPEQEAVA